MRSVGCTRFVRADMMLLSGVVLSVVLLNPPEMHQTLGGSSASGTPLFLCQGRSVRLIAMSVRRQIVCVLSKTIPLCQIPVLDGNVVLKVPLLWGLFFIFSKYRAFG